MWPGVVAGLAPFLWLSAFPVNALQSTFTDSQLVFTGPGWQTASSPQSCSQISSTVHITTNLLDSATFRFFGNGLLIRGPVNASSATSPIVLIDGALQPQYTLEESVSSCGVLFSTGNLTLASHNLQIIAAAGSTPLAISGVTVFTPDPGSAVFTANVPPPTNTTQPRIVSVLPTTVPQTTVAGTIPTPTITSPPSVPSNLTTTPLPSATGSNAPPPLIPENSSFTTTKSMIVAVVGALVGTMVAMLILLVGFVVVRRRVTRNAAQQRDRENGSDREMRGLEDGKIRIIENLAFTPSTSTDKGSLSQFVMVSGPVSSTESFPNPFPIITGQSGSTLPVRTSMPFASSTHPQPGIFTQNQHTPSMLHANTVDGIVHTPSLGILPGTPPIPVEVEVRPVSALVDGSSLAPPSHRPIKVPLRLSIPPRDENPSHPPSSLRSSLSYLKVSPSSPQSSRSHHSRSSVATSIQNKSSNPSRTSSPRRSLFALYPSSQRESSGSKNGSIPSNLPLGFF